MNTLRRFLYALASFLGDVNAIRHGPKAIAQRYARKVLTKEASKLIRKAIR